MTNISKNIMNFITKDWAEYCNDDNQSMSDSEFATLPLPQFQISDTESELKESTPMEPTPAKEKEKRINEKSNQWMIAGRQQYRRKNVRQYQRKHHEKPTPAKNILEGRINGKVIARIWKKITQHKRYYYYVIVVEGAKLKKYMQEQIGTDRILAKVSSIREDEANMLYFDHKKREKRICQKIQFSIRANGSHLFGGIEAYDLRLRRY